MFGFRREQRRQDIIEEVRRRGTETDRERAEEDRREDVSGKWNILVVSEVGSEVDQEGYWHPRGHVDHGSIMWWPLLLSHSRLLPWVLEQWLHLAYSRNWHSWRSSTGSTSSSLGPARSLSDRQTCHFLRNHQKQKNCFQKNSQLVYCLTSSVNPIL